MLRRILSAVSAFDWKHALQACLIALGAVGLGLAYAGLLIGWYTR